MDTYICTSSSYAGCLPVCLARYGGAVYLLVNRNDSSCFMYRTLHQFIDVHWWSTDLQVTSQTHDSVAGGADLASNIIITRHRVLIMDQCTFMLTGINVAALGQALAQASVSLTMFQMHDDIISHVTISRSSWSKTRLDVRSPGGKDCVVGAYMYAQHTYLRSIINQYLFACVTQ